MTSPAFPLHSSRRPGLPSSRSSNATLSNRAGPGLQTQTRPSSATSNLPPQFETLFHIAGVDLNEPRVSLALSVALQAFRKLESSILSFSQEAAKYVSSPSRPGMEPSSLEEALMTVPDLESIPYRVVRKYEGFQIRELGSYLVAETAMSPASSGFDFVGSSQAFNALAGYLFGKNVQKEEMEMTTPVMSSRGKGERGVEMEMTTPVVSWRTREQDGVEMEMTTPVINTQGSPGSGWSMSFVLPSKYSEADIPAPQDASVRIRRVPARTVAVLAFPGIVTAAEVARRETALRVLVSRTSDYTVIPGARAEVAQYNPPFTLPFMRRNEVVLDVEPAGEALRKGFI